MKRSLKLPIILFSLLFVISGAIFGAFARISAKSEEVKNQFTVGNVKIELTEPEWEVPAGSDINPENPGDTVNKDPQVTVDADSNPCWVYLVVGIPVAPTVEMTTNDWSGAYALADQSFTIPITAYGIQDNFYGLSDPKEIWNKFKSDMNWNVFNTEYARKDPDDNNFQTSAGTRNLEYVYLEVVKTRFVENSSFSAYSPEWSTVEYNYTDSVKYNYYVYTCGLVQPGETTAPLFNQCQISDIFGNFRQNYVYFEKNGAVIDAIQFVFNDVQNEHTSIQLTDYGMSDIAGWSKVPDGDIDYATTDVVYIEDLLKKDNNSEPINSDIYLYAVSNGGF